MSEILRTVNLICDSEERADVFIVAALNVSEDETGAGEETGFGDETGAGEETGFGDETGAGDENGTWDESEAGDETGALDRTGADAGYEDPDEQEDCFEPDVIPDNTFSRSFVKKLMEEGRVLVNGELCKAGRRLKKGDVVAVEIPAPEPLDVLPENIPLDVVYEDADIIVINKQRGMVVHPAPGNTSGTLVNALLGRCGDLSDINGTVRPGIVHRIDKDTTGLICVAKNNKAHLALSEQLKDHSMARVYYAVTEGRPKVTEGTVDMPIGRSPGDRKKMAARVKGGREAVTFFRVLEENAGFALLRVRLKTGRTHQIRVHLSAIGYPVVGDPLYGRRNDRGQKGQLLHAGLLTLRHPSTGEMMTFRGEPPADFMRFLEKYRFVTRIPEEKL